MTASLAENSSLNTVLNCAPISALPSTAYSSILLHMD